MQKEIHKRYATAGDMADEVQRRGIDRLILSNGDRLALASGENRLERDIPLEHTAAARVHVARRHADLRVGVGSEIFAQKIDQAALALQQREQLNRAIRRVIGGRAHGQFHARLGLQRGRKPALE